jgi:hypothetical protein
MTPLFTFALADGVFQLSSTYMKRKREKGAKLKTQDLHYT